MPSRGCVACRSRCVACRHAATPRVGMGTWERNAWFPCSPAAARRESMPPRPHAFGPLTFFSRLRKVKGSLAQAGFPGQVMGRGRPRCVVGFILAGYLFSVTGAVLFHTHGKLQEPGRALRSCGGHCGEGVRAGRSEYDWVQGLRSVCPTACSTSLHGPCAVCQFLSQKVLPAHLPADSARQTLQTAAVALVLPARSIGPVRTHHSRAPPSLA